MSVNWNVSECPAFIEAKKHDEDSKEWAEFCNLRESLCWALLVTGFPPKSDWAITKGNWQEIFRRLHAVESMYGVYRSRFTDDLDSIEVPFTPAEVESMIGMRVNAGNLSDTEFWKKLMRTSREAADRELRDHHHA